MSMTDERRDLNLTPDLSGLFGEAVSLLRLLVLGMRDLVQAAKQHEGTFLVFAGNGLAGEMPLQKGVDGTVRMLHNPTAAPLTVQLLDDKESTLLGSAAAPMLIPAAGTVTVFVPFKNGLRAIVSAGYLVISGDLHY